MKKVMIYTDGACSGNPGPGGWGAILIFNEHAKELSGGDKDTTNNKIQIHQNLLGITRSLLLTIPLVNFITPCPSHSLIKERLPVMKTAMSKMTRQIML